MSGMLTASEMLEREFLEIRHRLLEVAAGFDRIDRADGAQAVQSEPQLAMLRKAARVLVDGEGDRARRVQMVFSDAYERGWQAVP